MAFLEVHQVSKSYDGTQALKKVDFAADSGEVHAIVGENGAGKSTLMKILAGAIQPDEGSLLLDGKAVETRTPQQAFNLGIRTVYQEFSLVPHLSVTENILMGQMPTGRFRWWVDWPEAHRRAEDIFRSLGFSGIPVRLPVSRLSVSQQQLVEIAKAVVERPRILILDEPSAVLSREELKRLFELIHQLRDQKALVLYISHRIEEVFQIADRITVLKDGQTVATVLPRSTSQSELIRLMVGRALEDIYPRRTPQPGEELLQVRRLKKEGRFQEISFRLARGEILGIFGLVGSGRSDLARCLFGAEPASSGEILLQGELVRFKSPRASVATGLAFVTEDRQRDGLVLNCSIRDNVGLATMRQVSRGIFLNRRLQAAQVGRMVEEMAIRPARITKPVRELSGGNQQKVVLAKWLLAKAKLLILDEPTRGVDVATKVDIYHLIGGLADQGVGIILISSELPEILGMCDRTLIMREGRLVGEFSRQRSSEEGLLACAAGVAQ